MEEDFLDPEVKKFEQCAYVYVRCGMHEKQNFEVDVGMLFEPGTHFRELQYWSERRTGCIGFDLL